VLLEEVHDELAVEAVIAKLLAEAVRPYDLPGGAQARLSASIGVSLFPDNADEAAALVKNADVAMYSAKQAGKNGYRFYAPAAVAPNGSARLPTGSPGLAHAAVRSTGSPLPHAAPSPEGE
jgi:predicted signal transduction protein with EAL and GGDEF domain